jgi:hypothetical protein
VVRNRHNLSQNGINVPELGIFLSIIVTFFPVHLNMKKSIHSIGGFDGKRTNKSIGNISNLRRGYPSPN